jgi:hypothetical protein
MVPFPIKLSEFVDVNKDLLLILIKTSIIDLILHVASGEIARDVCERFLPL